MPKEKKDFSWMAFFLGPLAFFDERMLIMGVIATAIETFLWYLALYVSSGGTASVVAWFIFHIALGFYGRWLNQLPPMLCAKVALPRWLCWIIGIAVGVAMLMVVLLPLIREYVAVYKELMGVGP